MLSGSQAPSSSSCPSTVQWSAEGLDKDLYIQTATVTVLAMDGKRRWLDIQKLVSLTVFLIHIFEKILFIQFASY